MFRTSSLFRLQSGLCEIPLICRFSSSPLLPTLFPEARNDSLAAQAVSRVYAWESASGTVFEYRGPRSVCRYIERLTEPGMTQALKGRGGICATVTKNGTLRVGDEIEVL